jgi:hypothetical protein
VKTTRERPGKSSGKGQPENWNEAREKDHGIREKYVSNSEESSDQAERTDDRTGIIDSHRIISYNLSEGERPGGVKVRYKIRIASGRRGREIDARQAQVIREVLEWSRQHRQRPR